MHSIMLQLPSGSTETELLDRLLRSTRRSDPRRYAHAVQLSGCLRKIGDAFTSYPSIFEDQETETPDRSIETLITALLHDGCRHTILLPTKIAVGKALMIARFNTYGFLLKTCNGRCGPSHGVSELQRRWESLIFSLLLEEVYQLVIERPDRYSEAQRRRSALDLLHLWEHRSDRNVPAYAPVLLDLWRARKQVAPVFGTMLGTRELILISSVLSDTWHDFLSTCGDDAETIHAVEEFIFGLSYEQISSVRSIMNARKKMVIDRESLMEMLGGDAHVPEIESSDPREMYRFFQTRVRNANRRSIARTEGPHRTLEEILLMFLLETRADSSGL